MAKHGSNLVNVDKKMILKSIIINVDLMLLLRGVFKSLSNICDGALRKIS